MSLKILKTGVLDTIQDLGRFGYQQFGINPTGAMDRFSAAISNILVGNQQNEAVIEMHFPAPSILFTRPALIALSGGDFDANINGRSIQVDQPLIINKDSILQFRSLKSKSHCYLAVEGGMNIPGWLNSYSTNTKAEAGGYHGRRLLKDDVLEFNNDMDYDLGDDDFKILPWKANEGYGTAPAEEVLVIKSNEWDWLDEESQKKFLKNPFYISPNSDRMGYRLASEPLHLTVNTELISSAVNFGTIQLLPDGQLIILMADHQTTGGYPRLGNIISTHLPKLAQLKVGEEIRFKFIAHDAAESLLIKQHQHLRQLEIACKLKLENLNYENDRH